MILLEEGPSSVLVIARSTNKGLLLDEDALQRELRRLLADLRETLPLLRLKAGVISNTKHLPWIAREMIEASKLVAPQELTPLAAVAGAIADALKERLVQWGFDHVVVNNGGDISVYTNLAQEMKVLISDLKGTPIAQMVLNGPFQLGIATSGLGGRSFTKGIADTVTVVARKASVADAAATFIGSGIQLDSAHVLTKRAGEIDASSDLADETVTLMVEELTEEEIWEAQGKAFALSESLRRREIIEGSLVNIKGRLWNDFYDNKMRVEVKQCL